MRAAKRGRQQLCDHLASYSVIATATQTILGTAHSETVTCLLGVTHSQVLVNSAAVASLE